MGLLAWLNTPAPIPVSTHASNIELVMAQVIAEQGMAQQSGLASAAVFRARQLNAATPASLEVKMGGTLVPAPNANQDTQEFIVEAVLAMQDRGEAFIGTNGSDMWVIDNDDVTVNWDPSGRFRRYTKPSGVRYRTDGMTRDLIVMPVNRPAGALHGMGWMQSDAIQGVLAIDAYATEYFKNNGNPTGVLSTPSVLSEEEATALKEQWVQARTIRTPAVLTSGMQWNGTSFSATDSDWVESHRSGVLDVAAISGVPPHMLASSPAGSSLTYQNLSDLWHYYWTSCVKLTYVSRLERMWTSVLGGQVRFDPEPLLVASMKDRVWSATELVRTGFEPDQSLDQVGMPPIPHTGEIPATLQKEQPT
jgi:HK97 family phage portal protein